MSTWVPPLVPPVVETLWLPFPNTMTEMGPFAISQLENQLKKSRDDIRCTAAPALVGISKGLTSAGGDASGRSGEAEDERQGGGIGNGDDDEDMMEREEEGDEEGEEEGEEEFGSDEMSEAGSGYADLEHSDIGLEADETGEEEDVEDDDEDDDDGLAGYL